MISLRDGMPDMNVFTSKDICIIVTPSTRNDYQIAQQIATSGQVGGVVIVNAFAKVK